MNAANEKLAEVEFFFMLMEKNFDRYEFQYFLNAFLCALRSATEHNRLHSSDPRFTEWYAGVKGQWLQSEDLKQLGKLRHREVHQKGTESSQRVGMSFGEGIESTSVTVEFDFRPAKPVGRFKTAEMEAPTEHPVEQKWVWDIDGEPDVMEFCSRGLDVVRTIIKSRDAMEFPD